MRYRPLALPCIGRERPVTATSMLHGQWISPAARNGKSTGAYPSESEFFSGRLRFGKNSPRRAFLPSLAEKKNLNQEANGTGLGYVRPQHFILILSGYTQLDPIPIDSHSPLWYDVFATVPY